MLSNSSLTTLNPLSSSFIPTIIKSNSHTLNPLAKLYRSKYVPPHHKIVGRRLILSSHSHAFNALFFLSVFISLILFYYLNFYVSVESKLTPKDSLKNIKINYPKNIIIGHLNINSLRNKFECLAYIIDKNIDILLLSESKLGESFPNGQFIIADFQQPFRQDRNENGGGLILYVREGIPCRRITLDRNKEIEVIVIEINLKKRKWVLLGIYNPHKDMINHFLPCLSSILDELTIKYENVIILGDFNCEIKDEAMDVFCNAYNLRCLVKENTCFKNADNPSCIDLILTNKPRCFQKTCLIETGLSDFHKLTLTVMKSKFTKKSPKIMHYRNYKYFNNTLFQNDLMFAISVVGINNITCE